MEIIISGLVTGAVFAIAASGLVVTYSTSGVFNFAHGALGMLCAYVYWDLRVNDRHRWPLLPEGAWPAPLALAAVLLVIAPAMGAVIYLVVVRGLRRSSELVKLVVPISMLLAAIGLANWIWKADRPHSLPPFFGATRRVEVFGVVLLWHDLVILVVAVLLAVALRVLLYRTRLGVSMRAVVDDDALVELNGARADGVSMVSWMIGVALSALAGILVTPFQGGSLSATLLTLLVINAFAAAMFGRLRNLPMTFLGAVVLGFATRMTFPRPTGLIPQSFDWGGNFRLSVPMIVLFVVLLVLPQDRIRTAGPTGTPTISAAPSMRSAFVGAGAFVIGIAMLAGIMEASPLVTLAEALASAVILLSLVVLVGYAGEITLATMALAGFGGMVMFHHVGHTATSRTGLGAIVIAVVATSALGAVIALPALRLKGLYLALATAAFSIAVEQLLFKEYAASRRIYPATMILIVTAAVISVAHAALRRRTRRALVTGAVWAAVGLVAGTSGWLQHERWSPLFPNGNLQVPRPKVLGVDLSSQHRYVMVLAVVIALLGVGLVTLRRSALGRRLTAMKNSPAALATLGVDIVRLKLLVFVISGAIAGLGGCLFAMQIGAVTAGRFNLFESMTMLMLLVVAGAGYVSGGVAAGLLYSAVFVAMDAVLTGLGESVGALHGLTSWLARFTALLPALIGIGLGRDPSGFLRRSFTDFRDTYERRPRFVWGALVIVVVGWFGAAVGVIGNWGFVGLTAVTLLALPRVAALGVGRRASARSVDDLPPELVGVGRPFGSEQLAELDRVLRIPAEVTGR